MSNHIISDFSPINKRVIAIAIKVWKKLLPYDEQSRKDTARYVDKKTATETNITLNIFFCQESG